MTNQGIIIGGCGSTGTSLLRQILNRHSAIYIAPETHLFAKDRLYIDWTRYKSNIFCNRFRGLKSSGLTKFNGFDLQFSDFDTSAAHLREWVTQSDSYDQFIEKVFAAQLQRTGKTIWGEKTPNNVYHFADIRQLKGVNVTTVVMVRNPYDTIASLVRRGYSVALAVSRYLIAHSFAARTFDNHTVVKYEDLVQKPELIVSKLCSLTNVSFETQMLAEGKATFEEPTQIPGWTLDESQSVSSKSIGGFARLDASIQERIHLAIANVRIKPEIAAAHDLSCITVADVAQVFGYDQIMMSQKACGVNAFRKEIKRYMLRRRFTGYTLTPFKTFPIEI